MRLTEPAASRRMYYLDVARVIAVLAISVNHAVNRSYANYHGQMEEFYSISLAATLFKTVVTVFSKLGVPLFMMITGILILNKKMDDKEDIKRFYKHNLLGMLITVEIWYALMYWYCLLIGDYRYVLEEKGVWGAFVGMIDTMLFQNQITFDSMWYMPVILCLYTTLPFVVIVKDKLSGSKPSAALFLPLIVVFLNNMVRPVLNTLLTIQGQKTYSSVIQMVDLVPYFYIYILLGYFVGKGVFAKWKTWLVAAIGAASFGLCCGFQIYVYSQPLDHVIDYNFPLLPLCAAAVLELARRGCHKIKGLEKPVTYLSRIAFGIYLLHIVIMTTLTRPKVAAFLNYTAWNPAFKLLFLEAASVGASVVIIALLSKVKLFKRYLFMIK